MKKILQIAFLFIFCINLNIAFSQNIQCKLQGKIVGRDSIKLKLVKATEDERFSGIKIPVINDSFNYVLETPFIEKYSLVFEDDLEQGSWKPVDFFSENCIVYFELHSFQDFKKDIISGGELTQKIYNLRKQLRTEFYSKSNSFQAILDSLWKSNNYYSEKGAKLYKKIQVDTDEQCKLANEIEKLKDSGELLSPIALVQTNKIDSINKLALDWKNEYIKQNPDILSYSLLLDLARQYPFNKKNINITFLTQIYPTFSKLFPTHPYTKTVGEMLNAINTIRVGGHFIEFEAPTIDGKMMKVSEIIKGKVAVIDLWASWCNSCRALSISMIPIYEKYKNNGFTIVGVANEYENTDNYKIAIRNDKYPWINLLELDNKNGIWNKYNISGSGGCTYLVDSKGTILAIRPNAKELEKYLSDLCK